MLYDWGDPFIRTPTIAYKIAFPDGRALVVAQMPALHRCLRRYDFWHGHFGVHGLERANRGDSRVFDGTLIFGDKPADAEAL